MIYQVLNSCGRPASNDSNDLCMFSSLDEVNEYIEYLKEADSPEENISVKTINKLSDIVTI